MSGLHRKLTPWPNNARLLWCLCVVLAAAAVFVGMDAYRLAGEAGADRERYERLHKLSRPKVQIQPSRNEQEEQKRWAGLRAERAFDWYPVFLGLENSSEADIELLEFEPDKAGRKLVLRGEARNIEALTDYMERLSAQPVFGQVYLAHEKVKARGTMALVVFEIRAMIVSPQ
jgi:hypothetical protein